MMPPDSADVLPAPPWRDRTSALVAYGWVLVVSGALCIIGTVLLAFLVALSPALTTPSARGGLLFDGIFYVLVGAFLIALGVGSIRARRWARALTVVLAWCWLAMGAVMILVTGIVLPGILSSSGLPPGAMTCGLVGAVLVMALFFVAVPLVLLLFYKREDVRRTVEARDPLPGWTDTLSPSLLAILLALVVSGVAAIPAIAVVRALPLFGAMLTGFSARAAVLAFGIGSFALAWGVWKRSPAAWWGLQLFQVVGLVNLFTLRDLDMTELARASGFAQDPKAVEIQTRLFHNAAFYGVLVVVWIALAWFLWAVRDQFRVELFPKRGRGRGQNA